MGGKLLEKPPEIKRATEIFLEQFPYYLSIGMTSNEYWNGEPSLVKYYREAQRLRSENQNYRAWLQGMYIYEALCDVSPILNAFAKSGTKPLPYPKKPYGYDETKQTEDEKRKAEENERLKAQVWMNSIVDKFKYKGDGNEC